MRIRKKEREKIEEETFFNSFMFVCLIFLFFVCSDLGNIYFEIVVALQVGTTLSPTGKWSKFIH